MTNRHVFYAHLPYRLLACILCGLSLVVVSGCAAHVDDKFAAESFDENTEPLTNAVVGSPTGTVVIGPDGRIISTAPGDAGTSGVSTATGIGIGIGPSTGTDIGTGTSVGTSTTTTTATSIGTGIRTGGGTGVNTGTGTGGGSSSGSSGGSFDGGSPSEDGGADGGADGGGGFGSWHFDDCSPTSHFLIDSSGEGANAQQALHAACVPGISGLGVDIRTAKDIIQVPDEPQFTVGPRVAVAAWVNPTTVSGDQPIVIKRLNNQTAFSLGIHNGNIQMSVVLTTGKTVISQAPIAAGTWTHVAGMFDGTFVFLFIDGQQFGQVYGAGTLRDVFAPIRIGATTQTQHFNGIIDEVFLSTEPTDASTLEALACISRPTTFAVNPAVGPPVTFDTDVHYDIGVTDNDVGFCQGGRSYNFFTNSFDPTLNISQDSFFQTAQPGQTVTFGVDVTATDSADPGIDQIPFNIFDFGDGGGFDDLFGNLTFDLVAPSGCFVFTGRELMIRDTSVVDDPVRTFGSTAGFGFGGFDAGFGGSGSSGGGGISSSSGGGIAFPAAPPLVGTSRVAGPLGAAIDSGVASVDAAPPPFDGGAGSASQGVWTFGHLLREAAPTADQAPAMALQLFQHWLTDQTVNGFTVTARPAIQQVLLDIWPKTVSGDLDLDQAPLTLEAIVSRVDLRNLSAGSAGEGRFVFGVNGPGFPQQFTVILEYNLPAQTQQDVLDWANRWHSLSSLPFPSEQYNTALEAITRQFSDRNASPASVNGSALVSLRTNEIALSFQWELRQFSLSPTTGFFDEIPLTETPDLSFNNTTTFSDFVNQNAAGIISEVFGASGTNVTPQFEGQNFQAGSVFNNLIEWNGPGITNPDARFHASANTCNGCHGPETNTTFLMVTPRSPGSEAPLSPFLTGTTAFDQFTGQPRTLNDLGRRKADLTSLVCTDGGAAPPDDAGPPSVDAGPPPIDDDASPVDAGPPPSFDAEPPVIIGRNPAPPPPR
jgi:hypothetical protein